MLRVPLLLCCLVEAPADRRRLAAFNYMEVDKLTAADAAAYDEFGVCVAIDGDTIVIGAHQWQTSGTGKAFVFRTTDGGATYGQVAKLTAADAAAGDWFGTSVAIDGDTVVIGAKGKDIYTGAVYVFRTSDGGATYGQVAKLTASDAVVGEFGRSVAIDGTTIVVGTSNGQAAYVFRTSDGGATYAQVAKLDGVGGPVAIDGDTIVVGDDVFRTSDGGATYDQVAKLTAADAAANDYFGTSVAVDGDTVVIGAYGAGTGGAVYVFHTSDGGATYGQVAKLTASDAAVGEFGSSVAIFGATVVVSAPWDDASHSYSGEAYVFHTTDGGATYVELAKLAATDAAANNWFGWSVAIDGDTIVVGAYNDGNAGGMYPNGPGSVYVFDANAPTSQPTISPQPTSQPTAQPTKQVDDDDDVLAPWQIALISIIAGLIFGVGCFVCLHRMRKSQASAKTSPTTPAVQTPDDAVPN